MAGKVTGVTIPANLADSATATETWFDNVTNSISGLDAVVGQNEVVYVDTTKVETTTSVAETTLWTFSIPANTLGTGNMYFFQYGGYSYNGVGTTYTLTYKLYYGSTSISFGHELTNTSSNLPISMVGSVQGNGGTGAQILYSSYQTKQNGSSEPSYGAIDLTTAEDSTGALDFKLTATLSTSSANLRFGILWVRIFYVDIT